MTNKFLVLRLIVGLVLFSAEGMATSFPNVGEARNDGEAVQKYEPYLNFVLEISKQTDPQEAVKLEKIYNELKPLDEKATARLLKGMRYEMMEKLALMGRNPRNVSTNSPAMRKWITHFVKTWSHEADEALFRAQTMAEANKP